MKVLVAGASGQLGRDLCRAAPERTALVALSHGDLDIVDAAAVARAVSEARPDVVFNAAAYTAVDRAEAEREKAFAVNAEGAANLARAAAANGAWLAHFSTQLVFDGGACRPYVAADRANPLCVYGASKFAGEERVRAEAGENALVVRTTWLYGVHGHNFVKTMLGLMAEREELAVVADQVSTPTCTRSLAEVAWRAAVQKLTGVHHWSDAGVASRYDFAVAIQEEALALGWLERRIPVRPIASEDYPTPARRPHYSVLDWRGLAAAVGASPRHWRESLRDMLRELKERQGCDDSW